MFFGEEVGSSSEVSLNFTVRSEHQQKGMGRTCDVWRRQLVSDLRPKDRKASAV